MEAPEIRTFSRIIPMNYAYNTPEIARHDGRTKIGYTEKQTVKDRIDQQTHTADVRWRLAWQDNAMFKDGSGQYFTDKDFHAYLQTQVGVEREPDTEWFHVDGNTSQGYFYQFANRMTPDAEDTSE